MHTYLRSMSDDGNTVYVVGHHFTGVWQPLAIFATLEDAAQWASFLNGGTNSATNADAEVQS